MLHFGYFSNIVKFKPLTFKGPRQLLTISDRSVQAAAIEAVFSPLSLGAFPGERIETIFEHVFKHLTLL